MGAGTTGVGATDEPEDEPPEDEPELAVWTTRVIVAVASQMLMSPLLPDRGVTAVIVYGVAAETAVGVPEISPVLVLRLTPFGREGDTL